MRGILQHCLINHQPRVAHVVLGSSRHICLEIRHQGKHIHQADYLHFYHHLNTQKAIMSNNFYLQGTPDDVKNAKALHLITQNTPVSRITHRGSF